MATIPQELQDAWDNAQQALSDHQASSSTLTGLVSQQDAVSTQLAAARLDDAAKGALADQARMAFDQTADRLLSSTAPAPSAAIDPPAPATLALDTAATS